MLALAEAEAFVEVERHAADEQRRIAPGVRQHLREQARRGRLSMCTGDHDRVARHQEKLFERFGKAHLRNAFPPHFLRFDIVGADHVADHRQIDVRLIQVAR